MLSVPLCFSAFSLIKIADKILMLGRELALLTIEISFDILLLAFFIYFVFRR